MTAKKGARARGSINKRGNSYRVRYTHPVTKKLLSGGTYPKKGIAEARLTAILASIDNGTWQDPNAPKQARTLGEYAARQIETGITRQGKATRIGTKNKNRIFWRNGLKPFYDLEPDEVTPDMVRAWYLKRQQVAPSSASSEAGHLRAIFTSLINERAYDRANPVERHLTRVEVQKEQPKRIPPAQLNALIAFYDEQAPQYALAVCLGVFAGLRIGEIRGLTRADIVKDGERYIVDVGKQAAWDVIGNEFYDELPKTNASLRHIPLPVALNERVEQHLRGMDDKLKSAVLFTPRARKDGKPNAHKFVGKSPWRNLWLRACLAAGIDYMVDSDGERVPYNPADFKGGRGHKRPDVEQRHVLTFHGLRGIYGTAISEVSHQSYMARSLLGHAKQGVTERHYLADVPEQARAALADAAYEVLTGARSNIIEFKARSVA